jgi:hypothetical protein
MVIGEPKPLLADRQKNAAFLLLPEAQCMRHLTTNADYRGRVIL